MKKILLSLAAIMLFTSAVYADNWGMIGLSATVADNVYLRVDGQTGNTKGTTINFPAIAATGGTYTAVAKTDLTAFSNSTAFRVDAFSVVTASAVWIDGLVHYADVTNTANLQIAAVNSGAAAPTVFTSLKHERRNAPVAVGTGAVNVLLDRDVYYRAIFASGKKGGGYYGVVQFKMINQ